MNRNYWEKIAPNYSEEIFDVLHNDKKALIRSAIARFASSRKTVIDIGCAIGKWMPVLAPAFKKVIAVDISAGNLSIAKKKYSRFKNIEYLQANLSSPRAKLPVCDAGICINAILTSSLKDRTVFFHNMASCIRKGGHLVLTVPSLESSLLTSIIADRWKIATGQEEKKITGQQALKKWKQLHQGNTAIDGVSTKHYLAEELHLLLSRDGFAIEKIQKIEYSWKTEFLRPPSWLKEPLPWDWMVLARKV